MHKRMIQGCLTLNDRVKIRSDGPKQDEANISDVNQIGKYVKVSKVYCQTLIFARESNLWGKGPIVRKKITNVWKKVLFLTCQVSMK